MAPWTPRSKKLAALAAVLFGVSVSFGSQWYFAGAEVQDRQRTIDRQQLELDEALASLAVCVADASPTLLDQLGGAVLDFLPRGLTE